MSTSESLEQTVEGAAPAALQARRWPIAVLLGFLALGLGQVYNGQWRKGVAYWAGQTLLSAVALIVFPLGFAAFAIALLVSLALGVASLVDAGLTARSRSTFTLRPYNRWFTYAGIVLAVWFASGRFTDWMRAHRVQAFRMPSQSMSPTLRVGDFFFADKRPSARVPGRGDIIVMSFPPNPKVTFVKRVVAIGGDSLELRAKQLYVNGRVVAEPFVIHTDPTMRPAEYDRRDNLGPIRVPQGSVFVLGDNRENSNDSRYFGPVRSELVLGRVLWIYLSWDGERNAVRWDRIGRRLG
jgi:signal peptidase I